MKKYLEELSLKSDSFVLDNMIAKVDISSKDVMSSSNSKIVKLTERISDCTKSSNKRTLVNAKLNNQS